MPGVTLRDDVTIEYNDIAFGVTTEPIEVQVRPVPDQSGRVIAYAEHSITFGGIITMNAGGNTDDLIQAIRKQLGQIGGELVVEGTGRGDLHVNQPGGGGVRDVLRGPVPRIISERQVGDDRAWYVRFQVVTHIACEPEDTQRDDFLWWTWSIDFKIDANGQTTRTVSGNVRRPWSKNRVTDTRLDRTIDSMKERVIDEIGVPPGYRRENVDWSISTDKMEARYSVTHVQMGWLFAPPPGVISVNRTHSMDNTGVRQFFLFTHSFSAEYVMPRHVAKSSAVNWFMTEVNEKWNAIRREGTQEVIPLAISLTNMQDEQRVRCSIRWTVTLKSKDFTPDTMNKKLRVIRDSVRLSALFQTPGFSNWETWRRSLLANVLSSRGSSGMRLPEDSDLLHDLCSGGGPSLRSPGGGHGPGDKSVKTKDARLDLESRANPPGPPDPNGPGGPDPKRSWIKYDLRIRIRERHQNIPIPLLPRGRVRYEPKEKDNDDASGWRSDYKPSPEPDVIIQKRRNPITIIEVEGKAMRAGYNIVAPRVITVGGEEATPIDDGNCFFETELIGGLLTPLCLAKWRQCYVLTNVPSKLISAPDNPMVGSVAAGDGEGGRGDDGIVGYTLSTR